MAGEYDVKVVCIAHRCLIWFCCYCCFAYMLVLFFTLTNVVHACLKRKVTRMQGTQICMAARHFWGGGRLHATAFASPPKGTGQGEEQDAEEDMGHVWRGAAPLDSESLDPFSAQVHLYVWSMC